MWQPVGGAIPGVTGTVPDPNYVEASILTMRAFDNSLVVAGMFNSAGGVSATCIATWDGSAFHSLGSGLTSDHVEALGEFGGKLVVGGTFKAVGGIGVQTALAFWNGLSWEVPPPSFIQAKGGTLKDLFAFEEFEGSLYFGGYFSPNDAIDDYRYSTHVARLSNTGIPQPLTPLPGSWADGLITFNEKLYLYGVFSQNSINAQSPSLATVDGTRVDLVGGSMTPIISPETPESGQIARLRNAVVADNKLIFVGAFSSIDGVTARSIAAFDGQNWTPVVPAGLPDSTSLHSIASMEGSLIMGGVFANAVTAEGAASNVVRWDGTVLHSMGQLPGPVFCLRVVDGILYAGTPSDAFRWTGSQWEPMRSGANVGISNVRDFASDNGVLLAATDSRIYSWVSGAWASQSGSAPGNIAFARFDNHLYAVGSFVTTPNAVNIYRRNGATWQAIGASIDNPRNATPVSTYSAAAEYRGKLYIAGYLGNPSGGLVNVASPSGIILTRYSEDSRPFFEGQPADSRATRGTEARMQASLEAGAERPSEVTFQWRRDGAPIADGVGGASAGGGTVQGATSATLHIFGVQPSDTGAYDVVATSTCGTQLSDSGVLKVRLIVQDINADGLVDDADFALFVMQYDTMICDDPAMSDGCSADFNGDGIVDDQDFVLFVPAYDTMLAQGP